MEKLEVAQLGHKQELSVRVISYWGFSKGHIKKDVLHLHPFRNKIFNLVLTELYVDDLVLL